MNTPKTLRTNSTSAERLDSRYDELFEGFDGKDARPLSRGPRWHCGVWRTHPYFWSGFGAFIRKEQEQ
jgi:hypothetical protein